MQKKNDKKKETKDWPNFTEDSQKKDSRPLVEYNTKRKKIQFRQNRTSDSEFWGRKMKYRSVEVKSERRAVGMHTANQQSQSDAIE